MPVYEFVCPHCGTAFDKLVRHAAGVKEVTCPQCGSGEVRKKLSGFAVQSGSKSGASRGAACAPGGT